MDGKSLYYTKGRNVAGIWRAPVAGGEETLVLDTHKAGYWSAWTVVEQGIYLLTAEKLARPAIEFFSFTTGRVTEVAALAKPFRPWTNPEGLSVSADGRWIVYSRRTGRTWTSCWLRTSAEQFLDSPTAALIKSDRRTGITLVQMDIASTMRYFYAVVRVTRWRVRGGRTFARSGTRALQ
jgi:hypothetical protein